MTSGTSGLIEQVGVCTLSEENPSESAWIEVIKKMDEVYADLVHYQLELEEKNAELEEAHQFIRSVLSSMTDVLIVCDLSGQIEQVDNALLQLLGQQEEEILGQSLNTLFSAESQQKVTQLFQQGTRVSIADVEVYLRGKNDISVPLAMNCSPRLDHDGLLLGAVMIGRPTGELRQAYDDLNSAHQKLKQTQKQLVQSEKMASLGRLVAGVAHELNNPISFVFGNMHALQRYGQRMTQYLGAIDEGVEGETLKQLRAELKIDRIMADMGSLIDGTLEGAERVSDIVQDLRRYSGSQREPVSRFDLVQVIQTAEHWVFKAAKVKPELHYQLPEVLEISSRKSHVQQIMVNLIQNAVDVMEYLSEPKLEIACRLEDEKVYISVRDYGPGITEEAMSKVFDPFYTTKEVGKGTGLGLAISYGLARDAKGDLQVANHAEGGALFTLILPIELYE